MTNVKHLRHHRNLRSHITLLSVTLCSHQKYVQILIHVLMLFDTPLLRSNALSCFEGCVYLILLCAYIWTISRVMLTE